MDTLTFIQQVLKEFLGENMSEVTLFVAYAFAFAGMFIRWYFTYQTKGKSDPNTPDAFSFKYWFKDNFIPKLISTAFTVVVLFITLRFPQELLGKAFSYFYAFSVGLTFDYIISILKNLTLKK